MSRCESLSKDEVDRLRDHVRVLVGPRPATGAGESTTELYRVATENYHVPDRKEMGQMPDVEIVGPGSMERRELSPQGREIDPDPLPYPSAALGPDGQIPHFDEGPLRTEVSRRGRLSDPRGSGERDGSYPPRPRPRPRYAPRRISGSARLFRHDSNPG